MNRAATGYNGLSLKGLVALLIASFLALALFWLTDIKSGPILLLIRISVMLAFALILGCVAKKLKQPSVLGEILGGIILGPTVFGTMAPATQSWLFSGTGESAQIFRAITYLGLIAFVFTAGLQIDLACVRRRSRSTLFTSISGIILPFALGFVMVLLMPGLLRVPSGDLKIFALFMGTALSISALPVIARILMDLDLLKKELGAMIITAATIDDIIGWSLFALILSILNTGVSLELNLGLTVGVFALTICLLYLEGKNDALLQSRHIGNLIDIIAIAMLAASVAAEAVGTHGIVSAFLAGVILSQRHERRDLILRNAHTLVMGILAPIYFTSIGLKANFVTNFDPTIVLLIFIVACAGKILGAGIGAIASGMPKREALAIGFGMNARGAMEIILASVALDHGLIDQRIFVALVVMALATSMISGSVIQRLMSVKPFDNGRTIIKAAPVSHKQ